MLSPSESLRAPGLNLRVRAYLPSAPFAFDALPFALALALPDPSPLPAPASGSSRSSIASSSASAALALQVVSASASAVGVSAGVAARSVRRRGAAALPAVLVGCAARIADRTVSRLCATTSVMV